MSRFILQNRYQDSGWEFLGGESFNGYDEANRRAAELSKDAILCGMVRVVDLWAGNVLITYSAGGGPGKGEVAEYRPNEAANVIEVDEVDHADPDDLPSEPSRRKPSEGWVCPKCGTSNAPWMETCGGTECRSVSAGKPERKRRRWGFGLGRWSGE